MKLGCIDSTFNYLPLPYILAWPSATGFGVLSRLRIVKRNRYLIHALKKISALGFDCVQIMCQDPRYLPVKAGELKNICRGLDLEIASIGGYIDILGANWRVFKDVVRFSSETDTKIVCLHSGRSRDRHSRSVLISRLSEITDYADQYGIKIAIENSPAHMIRTDDDLLGIVRDVGHLYVNLDTGNLSSDLIRATNKLKRYIIHTHIKDSKIVDGKQVFTELGRGQVPILEYLLTLKKIGFNGPVVLEHEGFADSERIRKSKEYLEKGLIRLE